MLLLVSLCLSFLLGERRLQHGRNTCESLHKLSCGSDAEESIDALQKVSAVLRQGLAVDVEQDCEHVASESGKMFQVALCVCLGESALLNQVVVLLEFGNDTVGVYQVLQSLAHVCPDLRLLVKQVTEQLGEALVESLLKIDRKLTVTGQASPDLADNGLEDLDVHGLLSAAVVKHALEHGFTQRYHLRSEVGKSGVADRVTDDGQKPRATRLASNRLDQVEWEKCNDVVRPHCTDRSRQNGICLFLSGEGLVAAKIANGLDDVVQQRA